MGDGRLLASGPVRLHRERHRARPRPARGAAPSRVPRGPAHALFRPASPVGSGWGVSPRRRGQRPQCPLSAADRPQEPVARPARLRARCPRRPRLARGEGPARNCGAAGGRAPRRQRSGQPRGGRHAFGGGRSRHTRNARSSEHPGWRHRPPVPCPSAPDRGAGGAERLSPTPTRAERPGANPGDGHRHRSQAQRTPRQRPDGAVLTEQVRPHPGGPRHAAPHRTHRFRRGGSRRSDRGRGAGRGLRASAGQEAGRGRADRRLARRIADRRRHQPVAALQYRRARREEPVRHLLPGSRPR